MHQEDKRMHDEGVAYAQKYASEFVTEFNREMLELIATYGDRDAEDLFCRLRERFWARSWLPKELR